MSNTIFKLRLFTYITLYTITLSYSYIIFLIYLIIFKSYATKLCYWMNILEQAKYSLHFMHYFCIAYSDYFFYSTIKNKMNIWKYIILLLLLLIFSLDNSASLTFPNFLYTTGSWLLISIKNYKSPWRYSLLDTGSSPESLV